MARAFAGFVWPSQHQIRYTHGSCWDDVWLARILVPRVRCVCVCECFLLNLSTLFTLVQWPTRRITSIGGSPISAHTHVNVGAVVLLLVLQMKDFFFAIHHLYIRYLQCVCFECLARAILVIPSWARLILEYLGHAGCRKTSRRNSTRQNVANRNSSINTYTQAQGKHPPCARTKDFVDISLLAGLEVFQKEASYEETRSFHNGRDSLAQPRNAT